MAWNTQGDLIKGSDLNLYLVDLSGGTMTSGMVGSAKVIAYAQSCSLEINADTLDVTSKLSCRWNAVLPGNGSYSVSADALYCLQSSAAANGAVTVDDLFETMVDGDAVGWVIAKDKSDTCGTVEGPDTTGVCYYGEAAITSLSITGGNNEIATSSITLTGSGKPNVY